MKCIKVILFSLLVSLSMPVMAQADAEPKKGDARAKVEIVKGQTALVLKAGRNSEIALSWDNATERTLDSLVTAPWGSAVKMKDIDGHKVDVAKANVNSKVGLMFTSGSKCVAITKEEFERLRN